jgi:eukaryotic-like serine/threonine-protein kinase
MPDPLPLGPDIAELAQALAGQYAFEREIGRGGMGIVYRARDLRLERTVAIKVLPAHLERVPEVRERFLREARTAASLSHPNIVPIYRADELGGHVFFVMAYVDGESLAERVRVRGPLAPMEVLPYLQDVASALDYAHRHSIIHRDVKAENILIERATGHALITDFGIARVAAAASMTATGQLLGTVWYMSPEQVMGEAMDGRSDLYALGVVAYYALSGRFPFEYEAPAAVLVAHATKAAPSVRVAAPGVPWFVAAIVDRCLAKDPAARYASGAELAHALREAARGGPTDDLPPPHDAPEPPLPAVLSEDDAMALWRRAAELQSETGRQTRPPDAANLRPPASPAREAPPTSGYRIDDVLGAASEAGIGEEYVARAAAELGLVAGSVALAPGGRPGMRASPTSAGGPVAIVSQSNAEPQSRWRGAPAVLDFEARIDGEVPESELEMAVELIRRAMRDVGIVSRLGRSLTWTSTGANRKVHVVILPRGGRTTVRATEQLMQLAGGLFGGIMGGMGGGFGTLAIALGAGEFGSAVMAIGLAAAAVGSSYGLARTIYVSVASHRSRELQRVVTEVAEFLRDGMPPAASALPGPPTPPPLELPRSGTR